MTEQKEKIYISMLTDTTIKYLWKNSTTRDWFNKIILDKTGVDLREYELVDGEYNSGSKVKDYKTDLTFSDKKNSVVIEMNRDYTEAGEVKGKRYLFRRAGNSFASGEEYKNDRKSVLVMLNNYKKKDFEECNTATYSLFSQELNHAYDDIKICEIYLPVYHEKSYNNLGKIDKRLWLFTCTSYEEMYNVVDDDESLYIIQELERLSMNDTFKDEYDAELVNRTMMKSVESEGYEKGKLEGKQEQTIEIAKNLLEDNMDINFISKHTGLSKEEIESLK